MTRYSFSRSLSALSPTSPLHILTRGELDEGRIDTAKAGEAAPGGAAAPAAGHGHLGRLLRGHGEATTEQLLVGHLRHGLVHLVKVVVREVVYGVQEHYATAAAAVVFGQQSS